MAFMTMVAIMATLGAVIRAAGLLIAVFARFALGVAEAFSALSPASIELGHILFVLFLVATWTSFAVVLALLRATLWTAVFITIFASLTVLVAPAITTLIEAWVERCLILHVPVFMAVIAVFTGPFFTVVALWLAFFHSFLLHAI